MTLCGYLNLISFCHLITIWILKVKIHWSAWSLVFYHPFMSLYLTCPRSCTVTLDTSVLCTFMRLPTSSQISWCSCLTETTLLSAWIFPLSLVCCTFSARPNLPSFCLLYHNHYFLCAISVSCSRFSFFFFFFKLNSVTMFSWVSVYQVSREAMRSLAILQFVWFFFLNIVYLPSLALIHAKECHLCFVIWLVRESSWLDADRIRYTGEETGATLRNCLHLLGGAGNRQPVFRSGHSVKC